MRLLANENIPHKFLGGGTNVLVGDGELPWVALQLPVAQPGMRVEGNTAWGRSLGRSGRHGDVLREARPRRDGRVDRRARQRRRRTQNECWRLRNQQIGTHVREVELYRAASGEIETLRGGDIHFDYRHTSFAADDVMLRVKLELPSKPFTEILSGIRACNEKRRASQPLNQKSAGCIFKNPAGGSAGKMIDELKLKGHRVGDAMVSDRHANFFVNIGRATCADMLKLIDEVRERVRRACGIELENEVIVWQN